MSAYLGRVLIEKGLTHCARSVGTRAVHFMFICKNGLVLTPSCYTWAYSYSVRLTNVNA
jgi:hypothetical protein